MKYNQFRFDEVTTNHDRNRIPLSSVERSKRQGQYRYYGAQGVIDYVDDYLFDGKYLLIAEDGENLKSNKQNIAQIVSGQFWVNNHAHIIQTTEKCNIDYLCYLINSMDLSGYITGSAQPKLSQANMNTISLNLPDRLIQDKIVSILGILDTKISTNNEINKNLEAQAQALMLDYCDKVYDTAPLGTVMSFINGFAFKSSTYLSNGEYRIITIKNVQDGRVDAQGASFIDAVPTQMKPECNLQIGDVLLSLTGNVGRVGIVCEDNLLLNQRVAKFQPFDRRNLPFLYFYYRLPETKVKLETIAKGTAQANLSPVETLKLEFPFDQSLMSELSDSLSGMFSIIENNQIQNLALTETRDTLLPRLMSGELDVFNLDL